MELSLSPKDYEVKGKKKYKAPSVFLQKLNRFSEKRGGAPFIIGISVFMYLFLGLILNRDSMGDIIQWGGNILPMHPLQPFRFVTSIFLHGGFIHILFNMISAYYLAGMLDKVWDGKKTFLTFLITGIVANIISFYIRSLFSTRAIISVGASGGIFGLMGALLAYFYFNKHLSETVKNIYKRQLTSLFIFNVILGVLMPNLDLSVHIIGFLTGFIIGWFIEILPYKFYKQNNFFWSFLWIFSMMLILTSFIWATVNYWRSITAS